MAFRTAVVPVVLVSIVALFVAFDLTVAADGAAEPDAQGVTPLATIRGGEGLTAFITA